MKHRDQKIFANACLALAGVVALALSPCVAAQQAAPVAVATTDQPSPATPKPLDELDEVLVSGGRLYDRIVRAEDRFFALYNELNKNDDFDTNCAFVPIELESRTEQRFCMPAFFADAKAEQVRLSQYCMSLTARDDDGNVMAEGPCYIPPTAEQIFFSRREAYINNVMEVANSDPRLQKMGAELDALHREREGLARKFDDIKAQAVVARSEKHKYRPTIR